MHLRPSANKHSDDEDREKSGCVYEVRPWPQTGIVSKRWHYATTYTTTSFVRALCKCLINNENPKKKKQNSKKSENNISAWFEIVYTIRGKREKWKVEPHLMCIIILKLNSLEFCVLLHNSWLIHETNCVTSVFLFYVSSFVSKCCLFL